MASNSKQQQNSPDLRLWEHIPDAFGNVEDISDALISRDNHEFLLTDASGQIPPANRRGLGLYSHDTRHLSVYEFLLEGDYAQVLLSTADSGYGQEQVLGNHRFVQDGLTVGRCTIEVGRRRFLAGDLSEKVQVTNHNRFPVRISLRYRFDADFLDLFEVRGHKRTHTGQRLEPELGDRSILYTYRGADGVERRTLIEFDIPPDEIDSHGVSFVLQMAPRQRVEFSVSVTVGQEDTGIASRRSSTRLRGDYDRWKEAFASIRSDNEGFNQVIARSLTDLRVLWTTESNGQSFIAAGTPWFATAFGRDSIITSLQTLPFQPAVARECLKLLARNQGKTVDEFRAEEPGKIMHEIRDDELCRIGELPYERYYGSIDSTPLFLILAAEYFHWTSDHALLTELMPNIEAALSWIRDFGDLDGDGFIEHRTDSPDGLRNQGWKDSIEAIVHADGSLLDGPLALAEVQGYVFLAYTRLAPVLQAIDRPQMAEALRAQAQSLRQRFVSAFWLPGSKRIAMALDGSKRAADVMSSNAGQVLWSGILDDFHADQVRQKLFSPNMFSGWGLRTLSSEAIGYYPLGYHLGTVWPHDNGLIAMGLKHYGFNHEVNEIASCLFDAAKTFPGYRLPELFGGQPRTEFQPPVPYPVACRPQAWTAGVFLHLLQAMLGLKADSNQRTLELNHPTLPSWLPRVELEGIRIGGATVSLSAFLEADRVRVEADVSGDLTVIGAND